MAKPNYKKAVEGAYCEVNNVTRKDVTKPQHQKIISTALTDVWTFSGNFPNETDMLKRKRLEMDTPGEGEYSELAQYFKELYPEEKLSRYSAMAIIFMMYNRMNDLEKVKSPEVVSGEVPSESESSDRNQNNISKEKETGNMEKNNELLNLDEMTTPLNAGVGADVQMTQANLPASASQATLTAATNELMKNREAKEDYSNKAKVEALVVSTPPAADRLVNATNPMGRLNNVEKQTEAFRKATGWRVENGVDVFDNVVSGEEANAKAMLEALKAAQEDEMKQFEVNLTKGSGSLKGIKLMAPGQQSSEFKKMSEVVDILVNDAWFILNTVKSDVQIQLSKARSSQSTTTVGGGIEKKKAKKDNKSQLAGIATAKVVNRKNAEDMTLYHKTVTGEVKELPGFTSKLSVKVYRGQADEMGVRKTRTFRFRLLVEQKVTAALDEAMNAVFGDGVSAANAAGQIIDLSKDAEAANKLVAIFAEAIAEGAANQASGALFDLVREAAEQQESAQVKAQSAEFGDAI